MTEAQALSRLAHVVYFTLKDQSAPAAQRLVAACHKYLAGLSGIVFFAAGTRTPDLVRAVNDREFDVALQVVFQSREAHDAYQKAPLHQQFVAENKDHWAQVRVFDFDIG